MVHRRSWPADFVDLDEVAQANLEKTRGRWPERGIGTQGPPFRVGGGHLLDKDFEPEQQIPRKFTVQFVEVSEGDSVRVIIRRDGKQIGDTLTDNAYGADGYRFTMCSTCPPSGPGLVTRHSEIARCQTKGG